MTKLKYWWRLYRQVRRLDRRIPRVLWWHFITTAYMCMLTVFLTIWLAFYIFSTS